MWPNFLYLFYFLLYIVNINGLAVPPTSSTSSSSKFLSSSLTSSSPVSSSSKTFSSISSKPINVKNSSLQISTESPLSSTASMLNSQPIGDEITLATGPQINWGKCPQLEPSNEEKVKKATVITKCLEITPIPNNITRETIELHREQVAACALQMEGWFSEKGLYRFDKAESEIKSKKLIKPVEDNVLSYHRQCKDEAEEKYPFASSQLIPQIQLYQACMDYFISEVCGIEVALPEQYGV